MWTRSAARCVRRDRWLLIFDNAEDRRSRFDPLLPGGAGHVLITTRRGGFRSLGGVLDLDILDRPEAIALLRRRAPVLTDAQAGQLADGLATFPWPWTRPPLTWTRPACQPPDYLRLLDTRSADLYAAAGAGAALQSPANRRHRLVGLP